MFNFIHQFQSNVKLQKIGFKESDLCSFCETVSETLHHLLFLCSYPRLFWSNFECYWLSLTNERFQLSLQDEVVGIISSQNSSLVSLLNFIYGTAEEITCTLAYRDLRSVNKIEFNILY